MHNFYKESCSPLHSLVCAQLGVKNEISLFDRNSFKEDCSPLGLLVGARLNIENEVSPLGWDLFEENAEAFEGFLLKSLSSGHVAAEPVRPPPPPLCLRLLGVW